MKISVISIFNSKDVYTSQGYNSNSAKNEEKIEKRHLMRLKYLNGYSILNCMNIEAELADIKRLLTEISRKLDELLEEKEITAMMKLSEVSLKDFLEDEPDIYSIEDVKVRYR